MIDYHLHTTRCKHAAGTMDQYVQQALRLGLEEIAFTDHIPLPEDFDSAHRMAPHELEQYVNDVLQLRKKYPQITILLGIEADYLPRYQDYLAATLGNYPFDIVLLSVHFIPHWPAGQWVFSYHFPEKSLTAIYQEYLTLLKEGVQSGLFDVVAHLDLIKRSSQSVLKNNLAQVKDLLAAVKEQNMAVEINTSGWRKEINEPYPALDFLPLLKTMDIPLVTGSDAHQPQQVGFELHRLQPLIKRFNLSVVRYRQRAMLFA